MPYAFDEGSNSDCELAAGAPTGAGRSAGRARAEAAGPAAEDGDHRRGQGKADAATAPKTRDGTKQAQLIAMLRRPEGATIAQIVEATSWLPHTVRGFLAGALKKKLGLSVTSEKVEGTRIYRLPPA